ncbi:hypothetical protein DSCW_40080 [Desulfosarcina widdelii]|uniref:Uncharacterized protein n=1 Tax=Desulfosarcina widdelii TaxID=947919 RepID=A0A5K7ZA65_9BACT|nr:hypothetical protein [Desulfosarcina widdelii]BBO76591.1 hypothetical protein DSCW_40080 [Desulfosarcina widdelii]
MIDFILAAMSAALLAFLTCFILSFITLSLIAGAVHLAGLVRGSLFRPHFGRQQTA